MFEVFALSMNQDLYSNGKQLRKTSDKCASQVSVNDGKQVWVIDYSGDRIIDTLDELQI